LRLLCRDEVSLIEQRTAFILQLRHALAEYYPAALEAFKDWTSVSAWMFLKRFPTPELLAQAGKRKWQNFLHSRRLWGSDEGPRRMEIFAQATEFAGSAPRSKPRASLALSLVQMLFAVEKQLGLYRRRIEELFASHPDHDRFGSLPGAGPKIAPRLLAEIGDDRERFGGDPQNLQCLAGSAPVTKRSGKKITAKRIRVTPTRCADSVTVGLKSSTKCGSIEPPMTLSFITATNSNTAPGSFSSKPCNHYFFP
jgi:transposase